jgi:hypothetical protein
MKVWFLALTTLVFLGCATSGATIDSYIDPNFSPEGAKGIAIFPLRNARLAPNEALQINREIIQTINRKNPTLKIIGASEAVEILNDKNLAERWAKFLENYATSGIPDAVILREVGTALDVDKILQGEIVNVFQQDGDGWVKGITRVTVHYAMMDVMTNKTVWDVTSDGIVRKGYHDEAPPIIEAVRLAQAKILEVLPF